MSIWIKNKEGKDILAPHSYEKTLIAAKSISGEQLVVWIDGTNVELSFKINPNGFGSVGGAINTNCGVALTKEMVLEIGNAMKKGAVLKIAACNALYLTKDELEYSQVDKTVFDEFEQANNMVQIGDYSFAPKK